MRLLYCLLLCIILSRTECKSKIVYAGLMAEGVSPEKIAPLLYGSGLLPRVTSHTSKTLLQTTGKFDFDLIDSRETDNLTLSSSFGAQALVVVIRGDHHSYFTYIEPESGKQVFKHFYTIPMTGLVYRFSRDGNVIQKSYPILARSTHLLEDSRFNSEHLFKAYQNGLKQLVDALTRFSPNQKVTQLFSAGNGRFRVPIGRLDGVLEGSIVSTDSAELIVDEIQSHQSFLTLRDGKISAGSQITLRTDNIELPAAVFSIYPMTNDTLRRIFNKPEQKLQITQWATEVFNRHTNYRVLPPELQSGFSLFPIVMGSSAGPISAAGMSHEVIQSVYGGNQNQIVFAPVKADKEFQVKISGLDSIDMTEQLSGLKRIGAKLVLMKIWSAIRHDGLDYEGSATAKITILKSQRIDPEPILIDLVYEAVEAAVKMYQKEI